MRNIKLVIEYDGTAFAGWQRQINGPSIQGEIEAVLRKITQEECNVIGAGRTDAGVHARGQVANFRTASTYSVFKLHGALNSLLPHSIVIHDIEEVPMEFHARFSARSREYSYTIRLAPTALERACSWHVKYPLDRAAMARVAEEIVGEHDFTSFSKADTDAKHYVCSVVRSTWVAGSNFLRYEVCANRFMHGMVRALVGTMVDIGRGFRPVDALPNIIQQKDRSAAGAAAPAKGLVLERVDY